MASPFQAPPAGTPVPPNTSARYYTRQQVFSRVPISGSNWTSGKQASFVLEATGGRYFVPSESRIVMKLRAKSGSMANGDPAASFAASDNKLEKSIRFATDPVTNAFSLQCCGQTYQILGSYQQCRGCNAICMPHPFWVLNQ